MEPKIKKYDLLIKNGTVHTAVESFESEIGVSEGKIAASRLISKTFLDQLQY